MMNINQLLEPIQKALTEDLKIKSFTEIQEKCIPTILEGKNLIGVSETGSGKTLTFVLPLINRIVGTPKRPTKILIITPTKELSEQILAVVKKISRHTTLISMSLYGGQSATEQSRDLKNGVHVIVACPGRLQDHIDKNTIDLSGIEAVVLDEADQLMDMGFLFVNYNTNYIINEILSFITGKENQDFAKKIRETRKAEKDYTAKLKLYMSIFSLEKEPEILCQCCDDDPTWITPDGEKGCTCDMLFNAQEELDNGKPVVLEFMCRRIYENGLRPVDLVMVFVPGQKIDREYIKNILKYEKFKIK